MTTAGYETRGGSGDLQNERLVRFLPLVLPGGDACVCGVSESEWTEGSPLPSAVVMRGKTVLPQEMRDL